MIGERSLVLAARGGELGLGLGVSAFVLRSKVLGGLECLAEVAGLEQPLLELAVLRLERGLCVLRLLDARGHVRELLGLRVEVAAELLELLVLGEVLLAQVQELVLASTALGGGLGGSPGALELVLELRDLALELTDLAQRLAVVHARLLAIGVLRHRVEAEVDRHVWPRADARLRTASASRGTSPRGSGRASSVMIGAAITVAASWTSRGASSTICAGSGSGASSASGSGAGSWYGSSSSGASSTGTSSSIGSSSESSSWIAGDDSSVSGPATCVSNCGTCASMQPPRGPRPRSRERR